MNHFLDNRMTTAIVSMLLLGIGLLSMLGTPHSAKADQKGELCVFFACGNATINSGGGGGGGQPTSNTATLIVIKQVKCPQGCPETPDSFAIEVTGNNPSPGSFDGSATGTKVTLGAGAYTVSETAPGATRHFTQSFSGNCNQVGTTASATGTIAAGETQTCMITNTAPF